MGPSWENIYKESTIIFMSRPQLAPKLNFVHWYHWLTVHTSDLILEIINRDLLGFLNLPLLNLRCLWENF